jgi:hypothetical protein
VREGWYRAFDSGIAKALLRSRHCVRLNDSLTDRIADWHTSEMGGVDGVEFETSKLDRDGWLSCARDLLTATGELLFIVLSQPGAPYRSAICGQDAVIDILEDVLDREEGIIVLFPSAPDGFHFNLSNKEYSPHGEFSVAAWGTAAQVTIDQVQTMTCEWHTIPKD